MSLNRYLVKSSGGIYGGKVAGHGDVVELTAEDARQYTTRTPPSLERIGEVSAQEVEQSMNLPGDLTPDDVKAALSMPVADLAPVISDLSDDALEYVFGEETRKGAIVLLEAEMDRRSQDAT